MMLFVSCLLVVSLASAQVPVPDAALLSVRNAGLGALSAEIQAVDKALMDAIDAFKPINATCNSKLETALSSCGSCAEQKCKARVEAVCKPEQWQVILAKTIGVFKDGIPNFFTKSIPDVFVNKIGGGFIDITKQTGDFFKNTIGGNIIDFGKTIGGGVIDFGNGVVDIGKDFGNKVVDVGKTIGNTVVDVGNKIKDGFNTGVNAVKDFGSKIGKAFGSIFGKRSLLERVKRAGEPGCDQFEKDAAQACQHYVNAAYCSSCGFDADRDCAGYKAATDKIKAANAARTWMTKITDQKYNVLKMSFNPAKMEMATAKFIDVNAEVQIFGKTFSFVVNQPINPYVPDVAGVVVAKQALELFKSS